jgi:hypothetical protein
MLAVQSSDHRGKPCHVGWAHLKAAPNADRTATAPFCKGLSRVWVGYKSPEPVPAVLSELSA